MKIKEIEEIREKLREEAQEKYNYSEEDYASTEETIWKYRFEYTINDWSYEFDFYDLELQKYRIVPDYFERDLEKDFEQFLEDYLIKNNLN